MKTEPSKTPLELVELARENGYRLAILDALDVIDKETIRLLEKVRIKESLLNLSKRYYEQK